MLLFVFLCGTARADAQVVRGTVRDAESRATLQGVFVMLIDSAGQMRGGVLTDARGHYAVRAPVTGTYTLRADLIGHQSATTARVVLSSEATSTVDIDVNVAAIALAPVEVAARNRCIARPRSGHRTAQLWEEARKALTVARWVENQKQIQFTARTYSRRLDAHTMQVKSENARHDISRNLPYAAIDADTLARYGFVRNDGAGFVFYGPDAEVLLSTTFLDGHCFHSVEGAGATRGMVGLGFRPTADSRLPDIEGVLWLDRSTLELRHIEYRYTNFGREPRMRDSGGRTEFVRLRSGAWIVSKWHIRIPTLVAATVERGQYRVVSLQEEGGEVLSVREEGATQTLTRDGVIRGTVYDSVGGAMLGGALVYLSGTSHQARTDEAGRFEIRGVPPGTYTVGFSHGVLDSMPALPTPQRVEVQQLQEAMVALAIRSVPAQLAEKCPVYQRGVPPNVSAGVLFGHVRNQRASGIANALVSVHFRRYASAVTRTDETGYFIICGVPADDPLEVRVSRADEVEARAQLRISGRPYRRHDFIIKD